VASVPPGVLTEAGFGVTTSAGAELVADEDDPLVVGTGVVVPSGRTPFVGTAVGFILCPISVFKLFNSVFSSLSLVSVLSFWPSIAFGINFFKSSTSSLIRRDSSSLRREADLRSEITLSTSKSALSRRSVREASEALMASVSLESWSKREKAFSKEASMEALSCSI
jgi:hypothetical protein